MNQLAPWKVGEDEPWCLATNLPNIIITLKAYARRMWVEEMFRDLKSHGCDVECTVLRQVNKLSRLTLRWRYYLFGRLLSVQEPSKIARENKWIVKTDEI